MSKIAILLATYNGESYLKDQLDSLIKQSYDDWVCYVHDDGSTDRTKEILEYYKRKYSKKFVILNYPSTGSAKANFISLLKYPEEEYIMFCDQDDYWVNDKIETELSYILREDPEKPTVVFSDLTIVDQNLKQISSSYFKYERRNPYATSLIQLLKQNVAAGCTMMINSKLKELAINNTEILNLAMHDWGVMLLATTNGQIRYIDKSTVLYRQHQGNAVGAQEKTRLKYFKELMNKKKIKAVKKNIELQRKFAKQLTVVVAPNTDDYNFLNKLALIKNKNKYERIKFCLKYNLVEHTILKIWRFILV